MQDWLIFNPADLSDTGRGCVTDGPKEADRRQVALKFWPPATAEDPTASDMRRRELAAARLNPQSAVDTGDTVAGSSGGSTMMGGTSQDALWAVGSEDDGIATGDRERKRLTWRREPNRWQTFNVPSRREKSAERANVLRSRELSLKCAASGTTWWGYIAEMAGRRHFLSSEEAVLA